VHVELLTAKYKDLVGAYLSHALSTTELHLSEQTAVTAFLANLDLGPDLGGCP
jgi:hypothetical protein